MVRNTVRNTARNTARKKLLPGSSRATKAERIFVNRSLDLGTIEAIGFDMDHTVARYKRDNFEALAFNETLKKFIAAGYPDALSRLSFDPNFVIRGLLVDIDRGNLLKVDGHKYVKTALHGHRQLTKEERHRLYNRQTWKAGDFLSVDTFFALSEVQLFTEIVDFMNYNPGQIDKSFREVYKDLRHFIDLSHGDGSIKNEVLQRPEHFIDRDPYLVPTLRALQASGKHLFLLTNSQWSYTERLMTFLFEDDEAHWLDTFEFAIVGANKPGFFIGPQPFYEVIADSGLLKPHSSRLEPNKIYQGGNARLLEELTGFDGDRILYIGDHIYGDIIRSKELFNWRTMLIVEELEREIPALEGVVAQLETIRDLIQTRELLDEELQMLRGPNLGHRPSRVTIDDRTGFSTPRHEQGITASTRTRQKLRSTETERDTLIATKSAKLQELSGRIKELVDKRAKSIHPVWGELMKVGLERSRFADQVAAYACLYTSRVSNFRRYSTARRFTSAQDLMPHDL